MNDHDGKSATRAMARNMADLARDVKTLAELQVQLLGAEVKAWSRNVVRPVLLLLLGLSIALGCVPVLLLSFAFLLVEVAGLPQALSLLIAAVAGLLVATLSAAVACRMLRGQETILKLSRHELARNANWIIHVLAHKSAAADPGETRAGRHPAPDI